MFAYVISTFHNPTGFVLPALRRRLAETAAAAGVRVVDDEALADFGFPGRGRAAAAGRPRRLGDHCRVAEQGGLGRPAGRLGAGAGAGRRPAGAAAGVRPWRQYSGAAGRRRSLVTPGRTTAPRCPAATTRHDHLRAELAHQLPSWQAPAVRGGQTLWIRLPQGDGRSFAQAALRHGVAVLPGSGLDADGRSAEYVRVHFIAPPDDLSEAVHRLATAWRSYDAPSGQVTLPPTMAI